MPLFTIYQRIPNLANIIFGPIISYLTFLINICVFIALFDKSVKTPCTVLMQGLAIADGLTAFCTYGFEPMFSLYYEEIGLADRDDRSETMIVNRFNTWTTKYFSVTETKQLLNLSYPFCVLHYYITQLADTFHLVSILLTSSLGLQKLFAVAFPIWSHTQMTIRKASFVCCACFLISMAVNVPKLFVISFTPAQNGRKCYMSLPDNNIEIYTLTYYPVLYAVILSCSLLTMLTSTFYIIFTLLNRKRVRGHSSSSKNEKRSCMLIVAIMVVFLLLETPRIFLNTALFKTYKNDMKRDNIAWSKVQTVIETHTLKCYTQNQDRFMSKSMLTAHTTVQHIKDCEYSVEYQDLPVWLKRNLESEIPFYIHDIYYGYRDNLKDKFIPDFGELITDIIQKLILMLENLVKRFYTDWWNISYCAPGQFAFELDWDYQTIFSPCDDSVLTILTESLSYLLLGSSSYSEPMNYFLNIVWGRLDLSLHNLKVLIEILKLSSVIGCASNFVIYIVMSEKLRKVITQKLKRRKQNADKKF